MPLTKKGNKILSAMKAHYGPEKGESVFYASKNKGKITGVEKKRYRSYRRGSLPAYQVGSLQPARASAPSYNTYDTSFQGALGDPKSTTKYNWTGANPYNLDPTKIDWSGLGAQSAQQKRQMIGDYMTTGKLPGGGGGSNTSIQTGAGGGATPEDYMGQLGQFGTGLLDPDSEMSQRWMEQMREEIGDQSDAAQRAAGYQAMQSGFGTGASPELLQMQGDIATQGLEAAGDAASNFMLRAPELGVQATGQAMGGGISMRGQDLQSKIANEQNRLAREQMNAEMQMQQRSMDLQRELSLQNTAYGKELAALYSGPQNYSPSAPSYRPRYGSGATRGTVLGG